MHATVNEMTVFNQAEALKLPAGAVVISFYTGCLPSAEHRTKGAFPTFAGHLVLTSPIVL